MDMFSKLAFSGTENLVICKRKKYVIYKKREKKDLPRQCPREQSLTRQPPVLAVPWALYNSKVIKKLSLGL